MSIETEETQSPLEPAPTPAPVVIPPVEPQPEPEPESAGTICTPEQIMNGTCPR